MIDPDWCYYCQKVEPLPDYYYRVCAKCLHVFLTPQELIEAYGEEIDPETITVCPLCDGVEHGVPNGNRPRLDNRVRNL